MRAIESAALLARVGGAIACATFDAVPPRVDDVDAGDAAAATDGGPSRPAEDAGSDGGADVPSDMVVIATTADRAFLIDRTEVTIAAFTAFKDRVAGDAARSLPPACAFKGTRQRS